MRGGGGLLPRISGGFFFAESIAANGGQFTATSAAIAHNFILHFVLDLRFPWLPRGLLFRRTRYPMHPVLCTQMTQEEPTAYIKASPACNNDDGDGDAMLMAMGL